ncbi:MAG: transcriptional regulator [Polaromonas sp.]
MNAKKLAIALEQVALYSEGKLELRATKVSPPQVDVKGIRSKTGLSQKIFAESYGFSPAAIRNWEQGLRVPEGPARVLLTLIAKDPVRIKKDLESLSV